MKKRIIYLILTITLAAGLVACGKVESTSDSSVDSETNSNGEDTASAEEMSENVGEHLVFNGEAFSFDTWVPYYTLQYSDDNYANLRYQAGAANADVNISYNTDAASMNNAVSSSDVYAAVEVGKQSLLSYSYRYEYDNVMAETIWIPLKTGGINIDVVFMQVNDLSNLQEIKNAAVVLYNSIVVDDSLVPDNKELLIPNEYADIFRTTENAASVNDEISDIDENSDDKVGDDSDKSNIAGSDNSKTVEKTDWSKMPENPRDWPDSKLIEYYNTFGHYPPNFDPRDA